MFYENNSITIGRIANGFLVFVPPPAPSENFIGGLPISAYKEMAKAVRGKDVLEEIQEQNEIPPKRKLLESVERAHFFPTLTEALDYITFIINE